MDILLRCFKWFCYKAKKMTNAANIYLSTYANLNRFSISYHREMSSNANPSSDKKVSLLIEWIFPLYFYALV